MRTWESEKHRSWGLPAQGFMGHVATDGSLPGTAGKWGARDWAVVQLDYDEEMGPLHEMCGSMKAEYEVQGTIKRAELTASNKRGCGLPAQAQAEATARVDIPTARVFPVWTKESNVSASFCCVDMCLSGNRP